MDVRSLYNREAIEGVYQRALQTLLTGSLAFKEMLDTGLNPNLRNKAGHTLLHEAVFHHEVEAVMLLLAYGADPDHNENPDTWTPAHLAASKKYDDLLEVLRTHGADLTLKDRNGWSPDTPWSECYAYFGSPPHGLGVRVLPEWRATHPAG